MARDLENVGFDGGTGTRLDTTKPAPDGRGLFAVKRKCAGLVVSAAAVATAHWADADVLTQVVGQGVDGGQAAG